MNKSGIIINIEKLIHATETRQDDNALKDVRTKLRNNLQELAGLKHDKNLNFAQTIESIALVRDKAVLRNIAMILLRLLGSSGILPENTQSNQIDRMMILLFDKTIPDIYQRFKLDNNEQTYKKIEKLEGVHQFFCRKVAAISSIEPSLRSIIGSRESIQRMLSDKGLQAYLQPYDFTSIDTKIKNIFIKISDYLDDPEEFIESVPTIKSELQKEIEFCNHNETFLTRDYYQQFIAKLLNAIDEECTRTKERFQCDIVSKEGDSIYIEKKYPFHMVGKNIRINMPFSNVGPGTAKNVRVLVSLNTKNIDIDPTEYTLGDVKAGDFIIPLNLEIYESVKSVVIDLLVYWQVFGNSEMNEKVFQVTIDGQNPSIDWDEIQKLQPYTFDIARGEEFIGRKDAVRRIISRLSPKHMSSTYITGQKRVGKSSLAQAVIDECISKYKNYQFIYREYGEYAHSKGIETLNNLGQQLAAELSHSISVEISMQNILFNGSLSPLAQLITKLEKITPDTKFIIVLDEFDEINHELWRYGPLAETLFLNLRTISGKNNIAFILVGSEKMPYVIAAQGEKLNKFSRETLDTFDQETEWKDYEDLIRIPVHGLIEWHDSAIRALYDETKGHPYYTKLICAQVFDNAVSAKDAEITMEEVHSCLPRIIKQLDVNAFSHLWKDGIHGGYEDIEIQQLQRCRVLVGFARAKRQSLRTDITHITGCISMKHLNENEISAILQNFCVRRVIDENQGEYKIRLKLFERWLIEKGINILIADQFGDDLAGAKQSREDEAYVTPGEITKLLEKWPSYRGQQITPDHIRAWLEQVSSHVEQRMLFILLMNLRFPNESELREMLKNAHERLKTEFEIYVQKKKSQRRKDLLITYVDGPGKSGSHYAALYSQENSISLESNVELGDVKKQLEKAVEGKVDLNGIVIVDDFVGTGESISSNLSDFVQNHKDLLIKANIPIRIVVLFASKEGESRFRREVEGYDIKNIDIFVCEILGDNHFAFSDTSTIWSSSDEMSQAKALCMDLGVKIIRSSPLGYKDQGMLFVLPRNCPNNTLPILHAIKTGVDGWNPLFERITSF